MHCDKINLYHQSLFLSQKTTKKIGHNEKATTCGYRRVKRSIWTPMGILQLPRKMEDRPLYQQVSTSTGLGLTAAHETCTVVRATHRKLHKLSGLGKQKRKAGKLWMLKRVGESTSLTEPWTTRVQKRLKVILRKAKELSRVRSDCISNSVLQFKPCQEKDSLKQRKDYLPVGSNRIQRIHNLTFVMSRIQ